LCDSHTKIFCYSTIAHIWNCWISTHQLQLVVIETYLDDLQLDIDNWLEHFNNERPYSGKYCYGKTPMQTFQDSKKLAVEKNNEILYLEYSSDSQNLTDNQVQNL